MKWKEQDRQERPRGDSANVARAARLRRETTRAIRQIAEHLHLGSRKSLNKQQQFAWPAWGFRLGFAYEHAGNR